MCLEQQTYASSENFTLSLHVMHVTFRRSVHIWPLGVARKFCVTLIAFGAIRRHIEYQLWENASSNLGELLTCLTGETMSVQPGLSNKHGRLLPEPRGASILEYFLFTKPLAHP